MPGAKGEERGSILWWILQWVTCTLSQWYWMWKTTSEIKEFTGRDDINPIIPVVLQLFYVGNYFHAYKMGEWIDSARQQVGLPPENKGTKYLIMCFIAGWNVKVIQDDLNALWQAAGGGQG